MVGGDVGEFGGGGGPADAILFLNVRIGEVQQQLRHRLYRHGLTPLPIGG